MPEKLLVAHELFCLYLKSFHEIQPGSTSRPAPTERARFRKAGKNLPLAGPLALRK